MNATELRTAVLRAHGATAGQTEELLRYSTNSFDGSLLLSPPAFPLPDEEFVATWRTYADQAEPGHVFDFLAARLPQLRCPVEEGTSRSEQYIAAVRRGAQFDDAPGLRLRTPESLQVLIHPTAAGAIPILFTPERCDFVSLVQALTERNEPVEVPESMGACIVSGYNNWDRIRSWRESREITEPNATAEHRAADFQSFVRQKHLYQDRFLVLSGGYYSGVLPQDLELTEEHWRSQSVIIRREHECTHYFTRRVFGSMRNHLLDELIADYCGIVAAEGYFRSDWFLRFVGLEDYPRYRPGARLENYLGEPELTPGALRVLHSVLRAAAESLERFSVDAGHERPPGAAGPLVLMALCTFTLEELAHSDCPKLVCDAYNQLSARSPSHPSVGGVMQEGDSIEKLCHFRG
jgi:hypothetical protein